MNISSARVVARLPRRLAPKLSGVQSGRLQLRSRTIVYSQYPGGILELSEESIEQAIQDARTDLEQLFDQTVGITGVVELADLDGPSVKLRLKGRFWHKRTDVLARMRVYLQERIPEILEVEIENESQFDDNKFDDF